MKGFTLLETVIVIGLTVFIMAALGNFYLNFNSVLGINGGRISVASGARNVMSEAETMILPAKQVLSSYEFSGTIYTTDANTIVLELPAINSSGTFIEGKYDHAVFYVSGTTVYRLLQADPESSRISGIKQLSTAVHALSFSYDNADFTQVRKVDVTIQTSIVIKGESITHQLHEQIYLRNH